jgi:hypothetical protein
MTPVTFAEFGRLISRFRAAEMVRFRAKVTKTNRPAGDDALASNASRIEKTPVSRPADAKGE